MFLSSNKFYSVVSMTTLLTSAPFLCCNASNISGQGLRGLDKDPDDFFSTENRALSKASNYKKFSLHTGTALHETGGNFDFALARNLDLYAIKKRATGTKSTEIHVLSKASNYKKFSLHTGTALHETGGNFDFTLAPNLDLYAIKKSATGTRSTEIHVLSKASNYKKFSLHTGTALHETGGNFDFTLAPNLDVYAIKKRATGTKSTEIRVLSKAGN
uniref:Uncharacterized protein n=1 Tax=Corethron hystrix TaxID=216773 RepID=A0A7S1C061_9STRA|mmetsp:Transcript_6197/g.13383  ORF Transcript_6197/g.13383 Transcript_6197/m.13383 type:complete len:216 (+) Transcript_6197:67-714(+)